MLHVTDCEALRRQLKTLAEHVHSLIDKQAPDEANANAMLAYRHLEDASMRLGKTIQALDGGVSIYDKTQVSQTS